MRYQLRRHLSECSSAIGHPLRSKNYEAGCCRCGASSQADSMNNTSNQELANQTNSVTNSSTARTARSPTPCVSASPEEVQRRMKLEQQTSSIDSSDPKISEGCTAEASLPASQQSPTIPLPSSSSKAVDNSTEAINENYEPIDDGCAPPLALWNLERAALYRDS